MASAFQRAQDGFDRTRIDDKMCLQSRQFSVLWQSGDDIGFVDFQAMGQVIFSVLEAFESHHIVLMRQIKLQNIGCISALSDLSQKLPSNFTWRKH